MSRKNIYDILRDNKVDSVKAFARIRHRYYRVAHAFRITKNETEYHTIAELVDTILLPYLPIAGTCIDTSDLLRDLGIDLNNINPTPDDLFALIEFIWCIIDSTPETIIDCTSSETGKSNLYSDITKVIEATLEDFGCQELETEDGRIVVSRDCSTEQAAILVSDNSVSLDLLQYNHHLNDGDLNAKREILQNISSYIEPILQERSSHENENWRSTADMVSNLLNNFHIRHNNKAGAHKKDYIVNMDDVELEKWYDRTFNAIVMLLIEREGGDTAQELKRIQKSR